MKENLDEKYTLISEFAKQLNNKQFNQFLEIIEIISDLKNKKNLFTNLKKDYSTKTLDLSIDTDHEKLKDDWLKEIYYKDLLKIYSVLKNDELLKELGGAKMLIYGKTGTGKTSLVKKIKQDNPEFEYLEIDFTSLVSPKMGQTQINILNLANQLNNTNNKKIIFLDEVDSLISNRLNSDLGEHSRIVATFIKFLDLLNWNIFFIAATNIHDILDSAIYRRFNILLESKEVNIDTVFDFLEKEGFQISTQKKTFIKKYINKKTFSFAELRQLVNNKKIELYNPESIFKEDYEIFLLTFINDFNVKEIQQNEQSRRIFSSIKKIYLEKDE